MSEVKSVRAKFHCNQITILEYGGKQAVLNAIYSDKGENKDFAEATPNGELKIQINNNTPAVDFFVPGKNYYLEFTPVEE